eukprot:gene10619-10689_t
MWEGCLNNDRKQQELLYKALAPRMMAVCMRYAHDKDEAQDILQEGFIKMFNNVHKYRGEGNLEGWIRRIMVHCAISRYRKQKSIVLVEEFPDTESSLGNGYNAHGLEEIGRRLGMTELLSRTTLHRARTVLKDMVAKGNLAPSTPTQTTTTPITVSINQSQKGAYVPSTFLGLSYETGILAESPDFLNENNAVLIQLLNNLGKGILRIGGNTSDETQWTGSARNSATPPHSLTTTDVDRLAAFSKAAGWPVFFGLNLGHFNPDTAALEADYVFNKLQNNLAALQIGNEPDAFKNHLRPANYNFLDYQKEWNEYYNAVKKRVPKAHFTGPDVIPYDAGWISSFANSERGNIHLLGSHYYYAGPASDPSINYHTLLSNNVKLQDHLLQLSNTASKYKVPFRITEGNSVYGGGKPGVSDVFASALWALNFMWVVAESNGQGVNFHGGEPRFAYTPITMENGVVSARPEYYAMLAFRDGAVGGKIIPATIYNPRAYDNCSVYACANPNGLKYTGIPSGGTIYYSHY